MNGSPTTRTRSQRVAAVELPPGRLSALLAQLRRGSVVLRIAMVLLVAIALVIATFGWDPPRRWALGEIPARDVAARVEFTRLDERKTEEAREQARRFAEAVYDNDPAPFTQLAAQVKNEVAQLAAAADLESVDQELWSRYTPAQAEGTPDPTDKERQADFEQFRAALDGEEEFQKFGEALDAALAPLMQQGVLASQPTDASAEQIIVRRSGKENFDTVVAVRDALRDNARNDLDQALRRLAPSLDLARHVFERLRQDLPVTLTLNQTATREQAEQKASEVADVLETFKPGDRLAEGGQALTDSDITLLELERIALLENRTVGERIGRGVSVFWIYALTFTLVGIGVYRADHTVILDLSRYSLLLTMLAVAVGGMLLAVTFGGPGWRLEIAPLMLLGMTLTIAYGQGVAVIAAAAATLIMSIGSGWSLGDAFSVLAPTAMAIALLDSVRHRSKLLSVGFSAGLVAIATTLAVGALEGQPVWPTLKVAVAAGVWSVVAGSLLTVCLQAVEWVFGVQTDWSLIELGDPAKPLLQELVRRAPGTYNHSITVASIAEAAAEAIGARGLLVRVGAYYHDIGKMLKPGYFIENQGQSRNSHDALVPAMSTLVIIAHVKDGADLARQNKLPQSIIDFIEQHHGTTLVEYFYRQAQKQSQDELDDTEIDENRFRYPGPKPQTKEAGVLMLADAVESACRALVEPTPARIESLVDDIIRKRLDDGQFDECGLTLQELATIGETLVKSLTAVYHGRVKYPDQETA